eukprot:TRINITY_DN2285_c0_g1_i2.p1 TRINITY_DN2285_c0_g1~~TRINITY_DN2285_c0_g1_i2.p1  ORF type:complete len:1907 (-),score=322.55 TRINITY_DN2285_c0_g1_i2:3411-9131(-)
MGGHSLLILAVSLIQILVLCSSQSVDIKYLPLVYDNHLGLNEDGHILLAQFDQAAFVKPSRCFDTNTHDITMNEVQFLPCCNSTLVDNCVTIDDPNHEICIDSLTGLLNVNVSGDASDSPEGSPNLYYVKSLKMRVINAKSIAGFAIYLYSFKGIISHQVYFNGYFKYLPRLTNDFPTTSLVVCQSELLRLGDFDEVDVVVNLIGTVFYDRLNYISKSPFLPVELELKVFPDLSVLPASLFHDVVEIEMKYDVDENTTSTIISSFDCTSDTPTFAPGGGLFPLPEKDLCSRNVPYHYYTDPYWVEANKVAIYNTEYREKRIKNLLNPNINNTNIVWRTFSKGVYSNSIFVNYPHKISFHFKNLYNSSKDKVEYSGRPVKYEKLCDFEQIKLLLDEYNLKRGILLNRTIEHSERVFQNLRFLYSDMVSIGMSLDWLSCMGYITDKFLSKEYTTTNCVDENENSCTEIKNITNFKLKLNNTGIEEHCNNTDGLQCLKETVSQFLSSIETNTLDSNSTCQVLLDGIPYLQYASFEGSIVAKCLYQAMDLECYEDEVCQYHFGYNSSCVARGSSSVSMPIFSSMHCTIPCQKDSDCFYGVCENLYGRRSCKIGTIWGLGTVNGTTDQHYFQCINRELEKKSENDEYFRFYVKDHFSIIKEVATINEDGEVDGGYYFFSYGCPWNMLGYGVAEINVNPERNSTTCQHYKKCNWYDCVYPNNFICQDSVTALDLGLPTYDGVYFCDEHAGFAKSTYNSTYYCQMILPESLSRPDVTQAGNCRIEDFAFYYSSDICINYYGGRYDFLDQTCWEGPYETTSECLQPRFCPNVMPIEADWRGSSTFSTFNPLVEAYFCPMTTILEDAMNASQCSQSGGEWLNFTSAIDGVNYANCHLYTTNPLDDGRYYSSDLGLNVTVWPGKLYFPKQRYNETLCQSVCTYNQDVATKGECDSSYHCDNPYCKFSNSCHNQSICESKGFCEARSGCIFPHQSDLSCPPVGNYNLMWTLEGCVIDFVSRGGPFFQLSASTCRMMGGTYRTFEDWLALNETSCQNLGMQCFNPERSGAPSLYSLPRSYSLSSKPNWFFAPVNGSCVDGYPTRFIWNYGKWVSSNGTWQELKWEKRQFISPYPTVNKVAKDDVFRALVSSASVRRQLQFLSGYTDCRFLSLSNLVNETSCLCGLNNVKDVASCRSRRAKMPVSIERVCSGFEINITHDNSVLMVSASFELNEVQVNQTKDLENYTVPCVPFPFSLSNTERDALRKRVSLKSRLPSTQSERGRPALIKNKNNIIVGTVTEDVLRYDVLKDWRLYADNFVISLHGMRGCYTVKFLRVCPTGIEKILLQNESTTCLYDFLEGYFADEISAGNYKLGIGLEVTDTEGNIERIDIVSELFDPQPNGVEICIDFSLDWINSDKSPNPSISLYSVAIINDSDEYTYYSTLRGAGPLYIFGIVVYILSLIPTIYLVFEHVKSGKKLITVPIITLGLLSIFILIRALSFLLYILDAFSQVSPIIHVIFFELPTGIFLAIVSFVLFTWIKIVHFVMDLSKHTLVKTYRNIGAIMLVILFIIFLAILIAAGTQIDNPVVIECYTKLEDVNALQPSEIVSVIYICFYTFIAVSMMCGVSFYGYTIIEALKNPALGKGTEEQQRSKQKTTRINILLMAAITFTLFLQSVFLVSQPAASSYSSNNVWNWSPASVAIYLIIVDTTGIILFCITFGASNTRSTTTSGTSSGRSKGGSSTRTSMKSINSQTSSRNEETGSRKTNTSKNSKNENDNNNNNNNNNQKKPKLNFKSRNDNSKTDSVKDTQDADEPPTNNNNNNKTNQDAATGRRLNFKKQPTQPTQLEESENSTDNDTNTKRPKLSKSPTQPTQLEEDFSEENSSLESELPDLPSQSHDVSEERSGSASVSSEQASD